MLQSNIDIPRPSSADSDTVITALETAAIFCSKGDAQEAMRWLRRAAESAGEAGDDVRALALSRTAADLSDQLRASREPPPLPHIPRPSTPPPPVMAAPPIGSPSPPSMAPSSVAPSSAAPSSRPSYPVPPSSRPRFTTSSRPSATTTGPSRAMRVAVTPQRQQPGVFEVRLLADGEAAPAGGNEAFLVMVDPDSTLLSS